uniref:Glutaredoxin n=1 Tax=uncultured bacterium ws034A6 TaxID=1131824 RepID=I1X592_9BACT|nr:glutaredoxin, GrxC [uncultured bacterium ws034A6]
MSDVRMYCTAFCPYCVRAEMLLKSKGVDINKIFIDEEQDGFRDLYNLTGRRTVPQIFIGDRHVGGFDDLAALESQGELDPLLMTISQ